MPHLFCFGLGYSAEALCDVLFKEGWSVSGTCRTEEEQQRLKAKGFTMCLFDGLGPGREVPPLVRCASHILISIPPNDAGDPVLNQHSLDLKAAKNCQWLAYLSTTGVYGDHEGGWVEEGTALNPGTARGKRRASVESRWQKFADENQLPLIRFRLAAIYGPGRNALVRIPKGKAPMVDVPGLYFSRIHVSDLARVLKASIQQPRAGAIYNVADDLPAPPAQVVAYAYELLGQTVPSAIPLEQAGLSELGKSFYVENKRVANGLIKKELGVSLEFPDYKVGLSSLKDSMR